jgi:hypothetical protein
VEKTVEELEEDESEEDEIMRSLLMMNTRYAVDRL